MLRTYPKIFDFIFPIYEGNLESKTSLYVDNKNLEYGFEDIFLAANKKLKSFSIYKLYYGENHFNPLWSLLKTSLKTLSDLMGLVKNILRS
jgi:hypothetical protein